VICLLASLCPCFSQTLVLVAVSVPVSQASALFTAPQAAQSPHAALILKGTAHEHAGDVRYLVQLLYA
jgi:hypothetical protein